MSITTIKQYNIFHPKNGRLNLDCSLDKDYEFIGSVRAENLVRSFYQAQNDFNADYREYGVRSTCVGDIVSDGKEVHMIMGSNYKRINTKHPLFKHIRSLQSNVPNIMEIPLTDEDIDELIYNSY